MKIYRENPKIGRNKISELTRINQGTIWKWIKEEKDKDEKIDNPIEKVSKVIDGEIDKGEKIGKIGKNSIYKNIYNELSKVIDNKEKCLKILRKYDPDLSKATYLAYLSKYKSFYFARTK